MTHYTTIEQAKHLVELGLDPKTADMFYPWHIADEEDTFEDGYLLDTPMIGKYGSRGTIPCWSIGALLELMPKSIIDEYTSKGWLGMSAVYNSSWEWIVYYTNDDVDTLSMHEEQADTLLEATYNMVCWLLENDYIKK